jgi:hypothetical protein
MSLLREAQRYLDNHLIHFDRNAFISLSQKAAVLAQAQDADRRTVRGKLPSRFHGVNHSNRKLTEDQVPLAAS